MQALYFRMMHQNVKDGVMHTVSISNTENGEIWNGCYLCAATCAEQELCLDPRVQNVEKTVDLLVVASLDMPTVQTAKTFIRNNQVKKVICPTKAKEVLSQWLENGAEEAVGMEHGECIEEVTEAGWRIRLAAYGEKNETGIVLFHDVQKKDPQKEDILLMVKPSAKNLPCTACIDGDVHACAMGCSLYNDYDLCKGHNGGKNSYVLGTLLFGTVDLRKYSQAIQKEFLESESVRFCSFAGKIGRELKEEGILEQLSLGQDRNNQYFLLPGTEGEYSQEGILSILESGIRSRMVLTGEEQGLCVTGFFTKRR